MLEILEGKNLIAQFRWCDDQRPSGSLRVSMMLVDYISGSGIHIATEKRSGYFSNSNPKNVADDPW
jgi:hypothetical protein